MKHMAILALFIWLILFFAPSLGQQTATDWLNEGQRLVDQGKYYEALQAYDNGIRLDPQWTDLYYHKGTAYSKLGEVDKAVEAFDMVNQINPKDGVVAYYWIGRTLSGAGRNSEAIQAYERSAQSFEKYGEWYPGQKSIAANAWYYQGLTLDALGRSDEAQNAYGNAIRLNPSLTIPVPSSGMGGGTITGIGTGTTAGSEVTQYCLLRRPFYPPQENCYEFYLAATTGSAPRANAA
jgi:tetratricopeptide (TPR) repeat protein